MLYRRGRYSAGIVQPESVSLLVDAIAIFLGNDKDGTDVPFGHIIRVAMN